MSSLLGVVEKINVAHPVFEMHTLSLLSGCASGPHAPRAGHW